MRRRTAFAAAALPLLLTAVACGTAQKTATGATPAASGGTTASGSSSASAAPAATLSGPLGDAKNIKVDGTSGTMPKVTFPSGNPSLTSSSRVIAPGDGAAAKDGDTLVAN